MKFEFNLDEKELEELIKQDFKDTAKHEMFNRDYSPYRKIWKELMKEAVREVVKENADTIIDRAVEYAGEYIGKKGVAKFMEGLK